MLAPCNAPWACDWREGLTGTNGRCKPHVLVRILKTSQSCVVCRARHLGMGGHGRDSIGHGWACVYNMMGAHGRGH